MSSSTASLHAKQAPTAEDSKFLERIKHRFADDEEASRLSDGFKDLVAAYGDEVRRILPRQQADSLKAAASKAHAKQLHGPGLRFHSLAEAKRQGVDLHQLRLAQQSFRPKFDALVNGDGGFSSGEIIVRALEVPFNWPPMAEPPIASSTVYLPPFAEGLERRFISEATGDAQAIANDSYLDAQWGRLGTRMIGRDHDAGDSDRLNMFHQGGFIVPFVMTNTSTLYVTADFTCLQCSHRITTSDEWGWSDFFAFTQCGVKFDVFWERDDGQSMVDDFRYGFTPGLDASGDGESYPGTKVMVGPGERRSVNFMTNVAFPAGKTVWIYVGLSDFMFARLNDVSIDISMDSAWQLSSLTVTAL
jgi:hypothetical protein